MYRESRNIEASIIDFLKINLAIDWTNVNCEKSFARIYTISLPSVCIRAGITAHDKVEVGSNSTKRQVQILIDIFADSDGLRLDLKDYIISKIKSGMIYYEYSIINGTIDDKTANGRITVINIEDSPIDFDVDKDTLDEHDKFRWLITLQVIINKVEN